jgi:hypothetical protein
VLGTLSIAEILSEGLHEFLDLLQCQLMAVTRELSVAFFGYSPPSQSQGQSQSQSQSQGGQFQSQSQSWG